MLPRTLYPASCASGADRFQCHQCRMNHTCMPRGRFPEGYPDIKLHVGIKNTDNKQQVGHPVTGCSSSRAVCFIHCPHSSLPSLLTQLPQMSPHGPHTVLTHASAQLGVPNWVCATGCVQLGVSNWVCPTGCVQHLPEPKLEELTDILSKRAASLAAAGNGRRACKR